MTTKDGGPAFPSPNEYMPSGDVQYGSYGMSLRDYLAAKAMQAWVAAWLAEKGDGATRQMAINMNIEVPEVIARGSYEVAAAMLKERDK